MRNLPVRLGLVAVVLLIPAAAVALPASAETEQTASSSPSPSAAPRTVDGAGSAFTLAVVPDTQHEVFGKDRRLRQRMEWLVRRKDALDLRFVAHVGDLTNWGWLEESQLSVASDGLRPLEQAGIPYSVAVGNHDTRAVGWDGRGGYGGGAYQDNPECPRRFSTEECDSNLLVRHTEEINDVLDADRFGAVRGAYEAGTIDNVYSTFQAGGLDWLVLDLELWPRRSVVAWANDVVSAHPRHNVVVNTHSYLTSRDAIYEGAPYGSTSPAALWKRLISRHRNIVMVLSGHVGTAGTRVDRGVHGNRIVSLRQNFDSLTTNPVRLITVDTQAGELRTRIVAPYTLSLIHI